MKLKWANGVTIFVLVLSIIYSVAPAKAQTEDGVSKTEILLGATFPRSGVLAPYYQDFYVGASAYFDYLNSKGGIFGRKIRLILRDDSGLPTRSVSENNALVVKDKVFALFNSAPTTPSHIAMLRNISQRAIPNLAVTAPYSGFSDPKKFPTTFQIYGNQKQEFKTLVSFYENSLSTLPLVVMLPDDDTSSDFEQSRMALGKKISIAKGITNPYVPYDVLSTSPLKYRDGGVLSLWLRHTSADNSRRLVLTENNPLILRGSTISSSLTNFLVANSNSKNLYANFSTPLYTDTSDPFVSFFSSVFRQFTPSRDFTLEIDVKDNNKSVFNYVSQQMFEGANAAYVVSQAISALGPEPTRASLVTFLRTKSKTLSTASFSQLDYSPESNIGNVVQFVAKYDGAKWVKNSEFYLVNPDGTSIQSVSPERMPLLQDGLPKNKITGSVLNKVVCTKGKLTKEVAGKNPKCPKGFNLK